MELQDTGASTASSSTQADSELSIYDPPAGKLTAKGGTVSRIFGKRGKALYHPKMPCLICGCPWWFGDDWDATCVRCGWCCESEGYDDDSAPLPEFKAKYKEFRKAILAGKTPAYSGKLAK